MVSLTEKINVMIVGSGAREHAFAWKIRQSPWCGNLTVVPGNPGMWSLADLSVPLNVPSSPFATEAERQLFLSDLLFACQQVKPDLVVVQTEDAFFVTDTLREAGFLVFGPSMEAAEIETSKIWWQGFTRRHRIAKPKGWVCRTLGEARQVLSRNSFPLVIKADGLARGKGVFIVKTLEDALFRVTALMEEEELGPSGKHVLIQEFIAGANKDPAREISLHFITDGKTVLECATSCDQKGLRGQNTGGIAAYSPAYWLEGNDKARLNFEFGKKAIEAMAQEGRSFQGVFYPGAILTNSVLKMLEVNARAGDPEWPVLMMRLAVDLLPLLYSCAKADGSLEGMKLKWDSRAAVCLTLFSKGYPDKYEIGKKIKGLEGLTSPFDFEIFHAGTSYDQHGNLITAGGRVLNVVVKSDSLRQARDEAYRLANLIKFSGRQYARGILKELWIAPSDAHS